MAQRVNRNANTKPRRIHATDREWTVLKASADVAGLQVCRTPRVRRSWFPRILEKSLEIEQPLAAPSRWTGPHQIRLDVGIAGSPHSCILLNATIIDRFIILCVLASIT